MLKLVLAFLAVTAAANMRNVRPKDLHAAMYTGVTGYPCVLLLNSTHQIGCSQRADTKSGALQYLDNESDVAAFEKHAPFGETMVVLNANLFNKATVDILKKSSHLQGIAVIKVNASAVPGGQSPESKSPNSHFGNSNFDWNPTGDGFIWQNYGFPIWMFTENDSAIIKELALLNKKEDKFPRWGLSMKTSMHAAKNTETCFRRGQCLPVGGESLWGMLQEFQTGKSVVMATATLDSTSFFHDYVPGVDAHISGLIALAAAQIALSKLNMSDAPNQLAFAYFQGESWDNMGSRMFVRDLQSFECSKVNKNDKFQCDKPFALSTKFTSMKLSDFYAVVDVSQIGLASNEETPVMYVHKQVATDESTVKVVQLLHDTSQYSAGIVSQFASVDTANGLPPSPAIAFHKAAAIPAIALAEHSGAFTNAYYHSHLDEVTMNATLLCDAATLVARGLHTLAYKSVQVGMNDIKVDCSLVAELVQCLAVNFKCNLTEKYLGVLQSSDGTNVVKVSHYTGVYGSSMTSPNIHAVTYFLRQLLMEEAATASNKTNCTSDDDCQDGFVCVGIMPNSTCVKTPLYYHTALPLGIGWNYKSSSWTLENKSESSWTESYWGTLSAEVYLMDDPKNDLAMLLCGLALLGVSIGTTLLCRKMLTKRYKLA